MESDILTEVVNKAGGVPNLAKLLNIKDQAVRQWIDKGYIPPKRHFEIHEKLGVSLHKLAKSTSLK